MNEAKAYAVWCKLLKKYGFRYAKYMRLVIPKCKDTKRRPGKLFPGKMVAYDYACACVVGRDDSKRGYWWLRFVDDDLQSLPQKDFYCPFAAGLIPRSARK